jgi:hypothetical protein
MRQESEVTGKFTLDRDEGCRIVCPFCGDVMVPAGSCHVCPGCGETSGCS